MHYTFIKCASRKVCISIRLLFVGGKDLKFEKKRMDQCNIVICTPGRLLQHMDENPLFDCCSIQVIVCFVVPHSICMSPFVLEKY